MLTRLEAGYGKSRPYVSRETQVGSNPATSTNRRKYMIKTLNPLYWTTKYSPAAKRIQGCDYVCWVKNSTNFNVGDIVQIEKKGKLPFTRTILSILPPEFCGTSNKKLIPIMLG